MNNRIAVTSGEVFEYIWQYAAGKGMIAEKKSITKNTPEEYVRQVGGYPAILVGGEYYNDKILNVLSDSLKILVRFGVGYDKIDCEEAKKYKIAVSNTPGSNSTGVADQAIMLMLALGRSTCRYDLQTRKNCWEKSKIVTHELAGKTVGLIGFGHIAKILRQYLSGFQCRILAMDDYVEDEILHKMEVQRAGLYEIAARCDFISLHVPLTPATFGMIDMAFFRRMKSSAYLINTCRGDVVNENDLIEALQTGVIAGAGLDVLSREPSDDDNPLFKMEQVTLSPHVSFNTQESNERTARMAVDQIYDYLTTGYCSHIVNGI